MYRSNPGHMDQLKSPISITTKDSGASTTSNRAMSSAPTLRFDSAAPMSSETLVLLRTSPVEKMLTPSTRQRMKHSASAFAAVMRDLLTSMELVWKILTVNHLLLNALILTNA